MNYSEYFQFHENYFWQFEDDKEIISLRGIVTIAYTDYTINILRKISDQGLPPFGSILLVLAATNFDGKESLKQLRRILVPIQFNDEQLYDEAMNFLDLLSDLPPGFKKSEKRYLLIQAIFKNSHNILNVKNSKQILSIHDKNVANDSPFHNHKAKDFSLNVASRDLQTLSLLTRKFDSVDKIIQEIAGLPDVGNIDLLLDPDAKKETDNEDFVSALNANINTIKVASLIPRIWSGLNVPAHHAVASSQPMGGVSDLTNKGEFDQLLVSEFAYDDILFMSRLANNESLYYHREVPPANYDTQRVVLLDSSIKNWGSPRLIGFAILLAMANHPKSKIECRAFVLGNSFHEIKFSKVEDVVDSLLNIDVCLHCGEGMTEFFKSKIIDKDSEFVFITTPSTLNQNGMLQVLEEHKSYISYTIFTENEGNVKLYKKHQKSKKLIQEFHLPLAELWSKKIKTEHQSPEILDVNEMNSLPLLFSPGQNLIPLIGPDGSVYLIVKNDYLLRLFKKSEENIEYGWEAVQIPNQDKNLDYSKKDKGFLRGLLNSTITKSALGLWVNGTHVLLLYSDNTKEITIVQIRSGLTKKFPFPYWSNKEPEFYFSGKAFYYQNGTDKWRIDMSNLDVNLTKVEFLDLKPIVEYYNMLCQKNRRYFYSGHHVLKNIHTVFINRKMEISLNSHALRLNSNGHISLKHEQDGLDQLDVFNLAVGKWMDERSFKFQDGSFIKCIEPGCIVLESSNKNIPKIYIPSSLQVSLAMATQEEFSGNQFFYRERRKRVLLKSFGSNRTEILKSFMSNSGHSLPEAASIWHKTPMLLRQNYSEYQYDPLLKEIVDLGADFEFQEEKIPGFKPQKIIDTTVFYNKYVLAFINEILNHGTQG